MKTLKMLFLSLAFTVNSAAFANSIDGGKSSGVSAEIEKMLKDSNLIIEEAFMVTVVFKVNDNKKIEIRSISSPNEEVNSFLRKRLEGRKLHGDSWSPAKIYELPVKVETRR